MLYVCFERVLVVRSGMGMFGWGLRLLREHRVMFRGQILSLSSRGRRNRCKTFIEDSG